jgi:mannitol-1-phosphate 5-dehydrogenase
MEQKNKIVIFGAGKIGRGFIADIFSENGYGITFIDANESLVKGLNEQKTYTIHSAADNNSLKETQISNYIALHVSDTKDVENAILNSNIIAVSVFPQAFDETVETLSRMIEKKALTDEKSMFNILLCTNIVRPSKTFKALFMTELSDSARPYFEKNVGLIDTLIIRVAIEPSEELKLKDQFTVVTNGYSVLPLDKRAFKGELPQMTQLRWVADIQAEEVRKLYTYNMIHAVLAYLGIAKGHEYIYDCLQDAEIREIAQKTLDEVSLGLRQEFGFGREDMLEWNNQVIKNFDNPMLKDTVTRVGADPVRKLKRDDRLTGAALLCRRNGIYPYYLSKGMAYAFMFIQADDNASQTIKEYLKGHSIKEAVKEFCQVEKEVELTQLVEQHYKKAQTSKELKEDHARVTILCKAYNLGYKNEKVFHGCAQCLLAAMFELTGQVKSEVFQACSGFSGGMGLCGDGSCGGYTGGTLFMGTFIGRRFEQLDGDKTEQYKSYEMAQKLHDKFMDTYGSSICSGIHEKIFGQAYCLSTKLRRDEFEDAGAHLDKCTSVIGMACVWVSEILMSENCPWF